MPLRMETCVHIYIILSIWKPGFDDGSPDGNDPLVLARQMAARGITLVRVLVLVVSKYFLFLFLSFLRCSDITSNLLAVLCGM